MRKTIQIVLVAIVFALWACGGSQTEKSNNTLAVEAIEVSVDSLLTDASQLDGKTVRFQATVDHACMHGGKRLTVFGTTKGKTLKVEATETSPRFASSLMGKSVIITGNVRKVPGSHVASCEVEEGNEVPEFAFVVDCIDFKEI
jgi:hypothetical protein